MKYYKALLFGSIGSIVETSEIQRKSFNKAFKQYGLDWNWTKREYQNLLSKSGGKDRISRYAKKKKIEVNSVYLRNLKTKLFNNYLKKNHLKLRPGVKNLISGAKPVTALSLENARLKCTLHGSDTLIDKNADARCKRQASLPAPSAVCFLAVGQGRGL